MARAVWNGIVARFVCWSVLDNWAHVVVAAFFILMAATVIIHMGFIFLRQLPLIVPPPPADAQTAISAAPPSVRLPPITYTDPADMGKAKGKPVENATAENHLPSDRAVIAAARATTMQTPKAEEEHTTYSREPEDEFAKNSLKLLSNILFVVILLELLRTIITYLETHDIQAIMQEFLVVGIISSIRKILLVGAEASLKHDATQFEFIQEASGVVTNIIGILLLILGLVMLKRAFGNRTHKEQQESL